LLSLVELKKLGVYDLHVHIGPELIPRRYTASRLAAELADYNMGAVVKHHFIPTTYLKAGVADAAVLTGSVTMNAFTGGIHPDALRSALGGLRPDPAAPTPVPERYMVWFPTISAAAHLAHYGRDLDPAWGVRADYSRPATGAQALSVLNPDGGLTAAAEAVLREIAAHDLVLGTGHLGRAEIVALVRRAVELGVRRIVVTHAWFPASGLDVADMVALSRLPGVYIEHSWFVSQVDNVGIEQYAAAIAAVGPDKTVLSSDGGQVVSDPIPQAWRRFITELLAHGVALGEIGMMAAENPRRLLFGDPA
jgi:hypothetical protein